MIKKIILSVIAFIIFSISIYFVYFNNQNQTDGYITIEIDYETYTDTKTIDINNRSLKAILGEYYEVTYNNGMLIKINDLYTTNTAIQFIKIFIDNKMALSGIDGIKLKDGMVITFRIEDTYGYS